MITLGTTPMHPIYMTEGGKPQFRLITYRDADNNSFLAYPPSYCTKIRNSTYPNTNRDLWQPSTSKVGGDICLGNESTEVLRYNWTNLAGVDNYDRSGQQQWSVVNGNACSYQGGVFLAPAWGEVLTPSSRIPVGSTLIQSISHGSPGTKGVLSDDLVADCYHIRRPTMPSQIPDELGNGQVSGGSSHIYLTGEILVEVPVGAEMEGFAGCVSDNTTSRIPPSLTFQDLIDRITTEGRAGRYGNRISRDFTYNNRHFLLLEMIQDVGAVHQGDYLGVFAPYVYLYDKTNVVTSWSIITMVLLFRAVDSIRDGAT